MAARGDVVLVDFPFSSGAPGKIRQTLVVQNDADNGRLRDTIVALISGNTKRISEPTQLLVDQQRRREPPPDCTALPRSSAINSTPSACIW